MLSTIIASSQVIFSVRRGILSYYIYCLLIACHPYSY